MKLFKKGLAELLGTFCLVLFGCGAAIVTSSATSSYADGTAHLGITALAFGLTVVIMAYAIGSISGCHINPAVSLGVLLKNLFLPKEQREFGWKEFIVYVVAQIIGGFVGALCLWGIFGSDCGFGANQIQPLISGGQYPYLVAAITEIILTMIFVFVVLAVSSSKKLSKVSGLIIGLALVVVHIAGIPLTGTSVNPARSLAPAVFAAIFGNGTALNQVWLFLACPLVGAALAAIFYFIFFIWKKPAEEECECCKKAPEQQVVNNITNNYYGVAASEEEDPTAEEEKPAEEPVAKEETPVEEPVAEEAPANEEEADDADDSEETEGEEGAAKERKKAVPFAQRLAEADPELKEKYDELAKYCADEYGLHGRTSVSADTYRLHKVRYVVFSLRGKGIKMHVAVNPADYEGSTLPVKDDSAKSKYSDVPGYIKVKSELSFKRAKVLIDDAMKKAGIEKKSK